MSDAETALNQLLDTLEATSVTSARPADEIDRILSSPPRVTQARSLRDDPVMQRFRDELTSGLIQADTVQGVLALLDIAVKALGR